MDIVAIDARQGKRGKRETVKFAGTEAKEQIDNYINEVHMAKEDMSESASAAASSAKLAESWATGGTFARDDEDVNNAKYWAEYAHTAEEHVVEAENAVLSAETKALAAAEAAALSETHAATSESHAETSEQKAELSESWAVGGTGKREGEDTNNAKYWAEYAKTSAIGVSSFNGRQGVVKPKSGDYSYDQISNTPTAATSSSDGLMSAADKTKLDGITAATSKTDGLMSSEDKTKLDGIAEGATKVSVDSAVTEESSNAVSSGGVFTAIKAVKDNIVSTVTASIESIKTAIGDATKTADGLMSAADKTKLDGIPEDAGKVTLIDNLTTTTAGLGALDAHAGYSLAQDLANGDLVTEYANAFALRGTNSSWQDKEGLYFYEGGDTSGCNIPSPYCFVLHVGRTDDDTMRGVAICLRWLSSGYSTSTVMWTNALHDGAWTCWKAIG